MVNCPPRRAPCGAPPRELISGIYGFGRSDSSVTTSQTEDFTSPDLAYDFAVCGYREHLTSVAYLKCIFEDLFTTVSTVQ